MINNTLFLSLVLSWGISDQNGYVIEGDNIEFIYPTPIASQVVYVSGNFNNWASVDSDWQMSYDPVRSSYTLTKPIEYIRNYKMKFYEFTFRVNDELKDANHKALNVIYCAGYGYRYVINWQLD